MVNSEKLIGASGYLTPDTRCCINRCCYNWCTYLEYSFHLPVHSVGGQEFTREVQITVRKPMLL
jgi:hypothetical protein